MKTPNESKKRKAERTPPPRREKSLRRNVQSELNKVSVALKKLPTAKVKEETEVKVRRTPRNLRKGKTVEAETPSPGVSLRKRRKQ